MSGEVSRLTRERCVILVETFGKMNEHLKYNGTQVFIRLFSENPHYKDIWPQFRSIPDSSLFHSDALRAHIAVYSKGLSQIITAAERDHDALLNVTKRMAKAHAKRGIYKYHIMHMLPEFLAMLRSINVTVTDKVQDAWTTLFDVIGNLVDQAKQEADKTRDRVI